MVTSYNLYVYDTIANTNIHTAEGVAFLLKHNNSGYIENGQINPCSYFNRRYS